MEREGGKEGGRAGERGREGEREGRRERDISSLSLSPADVAATRIPLILAADVDTTRLPTGLNLETCQRLG